ncbi:MAG: phosphopantetheine-binding protein [Oscillospiraceae bacterium]|nr:phosphopantetheine-binding protein [Oscillospiraceae bacterium]
MYELDKIIGLVSKYSGTLASEINEDTNLLHDLRMESMGFIDMVCAFEETFSFKIPERDFRKFITIKKICTYVESKVANKAEKVTEINESDDDGELPLVKSRCVVSPITKKLTAKVPALVTSIYGKGYASEYLYNPDEFWAKIESGEVYPYIAVNTDGKATGMISLIKLSPNPNAFELGQLMVTPDYRGTDVAKLLISCLSNQELKGGVIYSESITSHKYSQRSCIAGGFIDTALKLNLAHSHGEGHGETTQNLDERISCVCSCIERGEATLWCYLPSEYKSQIEFAVSDLPLVTTRIFRNASDTAPNNPTTYEVNDSELISTQYVVITFLEVGADINDVVKQIDKEASSNGTKSLAINVPLSCPHNGATIKALKAHGFYYGGVMPRWYPDSDGLVMQKLYGNQVDWESTKLFSDKIQAIAESIKNDQ